MHPSTEKTAAIKDQLKNEAEAWDHAQRYGLFSYKPHHGFGARDDTTKPNYRDDNGKVKTGPKNFMGGRPRSANVALDSFTRTGYLSQNDEYIDPSTTMKYRESSKTNKVHSKPFKPSADVPNRIQAPYEFKSDPIEPTKAGNVPKNFVTSRPKSGYGNTTSGHLFSSYRYCTDPFEFADAKDRKERADHAGKIMSGPFSTTFKKRDHFTPNYRVYRDPLGMSGYKRVANPEGGYYGPFLRGNLPKPGYNRTINRFPEYVVQPPIEPVLGQSIGKEGTWKVPHKERSRPSPSVQQYNAAHRPNKRF